jgi:hypothetical protein
MIYKRGRFYSYEFVLNGKRIKKSTKQASREVAKQMEAAARSALASGAPLPGSRPKASLTIGDLLDAVETDYRLRGILGRRTISALGIARREFGEYDALAFSEKDIAPTIRQRPAPSTTALSFRPLARRRDGKCIHRG